eukprot:6107549-Ditylum_brightwellii.AAC.1
MVTTNNDTETEPETKEGSKNKTESAHEGELPSEARSKELPGNKFSTLEIQIDHTSKINCRYGNNLDLTITDEVFWLYYQNLNGITLNNDGAEFLDEMAVLKEMGCSLISGTEPNNNWQRGNIFDRAKNI